jgi:3-dehydroquinate dehydratase
VLALQFVGFYAYFGSRLLAIRQEMRAALAILPEEKLEKIIISTDEFKRLDPEENEIELSGKMYDIAKIVKTENGYILFALHDEHEDNLLSLLDEMIKRSTNDKKPVPSQLGQFFALVFIPTQVSFSFAHSEPVFSVTEYINAYQSITQSILAPPPWA